MNNQLWVEKNILHLISNYKFSLWKAIKEKSKRYWTKLFKSNHNLLPFLPHLLLVVSVGMGVTSSILPILIPFLAMALRADWAPGPGALSPVPPLALSLMWTAVMPSCLSLFTTSTAAIMAAYGEDSSLSDLTFIPPVTLAKVYLPVRSVTWMKVSFHVARMWQTAKISPETFWGPRVCPGLTYYSAPSSLAVFFLPLTYLTAGVGWVAATSAMFYGKSLINTMINLYLINYFSGFYLLGNLNMFLGIWICVWVLE